MWNIFYCCFKKLNKKEINEINQKRMEILPFYKKK